MKGFRLTVGPGSASISLEGGEGLVWVPELCFTLDAECRNVSICSHLLWQDTRGDSFSIPLLMKETKALTYVTKPGVYFVGLMDLTFCYPVRVCPNEWIPDAQGEAMGLLASQASFGQLRTG